MQIVSDEVQKLCMSSLYVDTYMTRVMLYIYKYFVSNKYCTNILLYFAILWLIQYTNFYRRKFILFITIIYSSWKCFYKHF